MSSRGKVAKDVFEKGQEEFLKELMMLLIRNRRESSKTQAARDS